MGVLEGLVVATMVLAGAYVGYHAWQESLGAEDGEAHSAGPAPLGHVHHHDARRGGEAGGWDEARPGWHHRL